MWKIKDIKELIKDKHDEEIVLFKGYCRDTDGDTIKNINRIVTRNPKRTEFEHKECKFCEKVTIKNTERLYCNRIDDILPRYEEYSCEYFEHNKYDLEYSD